ncbi:Alpha/beta hydrolase fold protein OS=Isosphaera pallida (strain ATCC 43644 / DSM 9630 / IS1B) GN=Isop_0255 PE=4 SV=1: Abhydrolase_6 [Gemmata massiliana]|uniref:Serine aminopeptidase S33 domain-containing protein n=1 Tax=Gemmata massiliana TaxID=1210884 RepID=A0A6P2D098_9BACT|nr:Alpha/beta hydrolase fold protein OS=Isosphaera pallida (strain ATCC 43644 / DSM 9630 / IS1B) GN=Isop_0255 PE=4 SV=1: Abhydrolase_6 [Gemmata massiliana]
MGEQMQPTPLSPLPEGKGGKKLSAVLSPSPFRGGVGEGLQAEPPTPAPSLFPASDGYSFYFRHFAPVGAPRARIVVVHGIRSHGGWYTRSCQALANAGFDVYFLDRRGSGLNTAHRGDSPSFRRLIDDVVEFVQHLRASHGWLPVFVCGISWGGKLAVGLPYRKPGLVDGLILLCPGLVPKVAPAMPQRARIAVARVFRPWKFFPIPLNEPDLFTASSEWRHYIDTEPHGLRLATARFLFSSFSLDIYLKRAAKCVTVPALLALAEHDRIIDNAQTANFVAQFPGPTETVTYPGAHHTLEFEREDHPWLADVVRWVEKQL